MNRLETLRKLLDKSPDDTFLIYSLAMEHLSAGQAGEAVAGFRRVLELDGQYLPAYQQMAKALLAEGQKDEAIRTLQAGLELAGRLNDRHAADRMETQLQALQA